MATKNNHWSYYQPNNKDLKDRYGDCAVRALTKYFDITWLEAFDILVKYARQRQDMVNALDNVKMHMDDLHIPYISAYNPKAKNKTTVNDFAKEHKTGKYMLYVRVGYGTHLVTVVDGYFYDTWNCGNKIVYGYWAESKEEK